MNHIHYKGIINNLMCGETINIMLSGLYEMKNHGVQIIISMVNQLPTKPEQKHAQF